MKPSTDESPEMIIVGIVLLYILVVGFVLYLFFLHRISIIPTSLVSIIFTILYVPRFKIINKLRKKDDIKVNDTGIYINNKFIAFNEILDYKIIDKNPVAIFFISNKMIVFNEAEMHIKTRNEEISFTIIGGEKIRLLKDFFHIAFS
jgi:hypothetical protein